MPDKRPLVQHKNVTPCKPTTIAKPHGDEQAEQHQWGAGLQPWKCCCYFPEANLKGKGGIKGLKAAAA